MKLLENKTAIITGGARGIGKAIAMKYAQEGANVVFIDLNYDEAAMETEKELQSFGTKCKAYAGNVVDSEAMNLIIEDIIANFGRIDILVNNAGITRDKLLMRMSEDDWDMVINVNLKSAFIMTKAVQSYMIKQREGVIINMSSVVGVSGNAGQANYSASKAGLIGFTKSIAKELGSRNIRCNAIAPGFIETVMTKQLPAEVIDDYLKKIPLRKPGKPEDVANLATFLASDMANYITGQVITVCGGLQI
ncbi:3-oxoacyl-[acyl-carrier-protein] reductase [Bacteroidales bacterium OttesenSCG-928-K03]|nr:3-oxoacyl-[acyl-carrier-protein] reductase [Odoribacter sp. OttesenSCG-928-L07]MDL2243136.1 3-oxoacyl-[acyl-carrier-protein] reductase [Bacteroidales bacterium OttesenSCG-928-K03]